MYQHPAHLCLWITKYILNDFISDYKARLIKLKLPPLMWTLRQRFSSKQFNVQLLVSTSYNLYLSQQCKIKWPQITSQLIYQYQELSFFFVRICHLWNILPLRNGLPIINITLSSLIIRNKIKSYFWNHSTCLLDPLDPTSFIIYVHAAIKSTIFLLATHNFNSDNHLSCIFFFFWSNLLYFTVKIFRLKVLAHGFLAHWTS